MTNEFQAPADAVNDNDTDNSMSEAIEGIAGTFMKAGADLFVEALLFGLRMTPEQKAAAIKARKDKEEQALKEAKASKKFWLTAAAGIAVGAAAAVTIIKLRS